MIRRTVAATAITAAAMLVLTGCVNPIEEFAKGAIEKIIQEQIGGIIDLDPDGGFIIKTDDGDIHIGAGSALPAGFPASIPLPSGELFGSASVQGGWTLTYHGVDQRAMDDFVSRLKSAGFQEESVQGDSGAVQGSLQSTQWSLGFIQTGQIVVVHVNPRD